MNIAWLISKTVITIINYNLGETYEAKNTRSKYDMIKIFFLTFLIHLIRKNDVVCECV